MIPLSPATPARSDILFLEYRLEVVNQWPTSPRKKAVAEAISRRLTALARGTLDRPEIVDVLNSSCRVLDSLFSPKD